MPMDHTIFHHSVFWVIILLGVSIIAALLWNGWRLYKQLQILQVELLQHAEVLGKQVHLQTQLTKTAAAAPGVICSFQQRPDGSTYFPYASPFIEDLYGYTPEEVAVDAAPIFARIHPNDREHLAQSIAESARTLTLWYDQFQFQHPRKGDRWIEGHSMPQVEPDGSILWHGFLSDITDHKHAKQAKQDAHQILLTILDNIDALVYVADMETYEVLFANQYLKNIWGNVVGQKCWQSLQTHQTGPCAFCTNPRLLDAAGQPTGVYQWECQNTLDGRWYDCRDSALRWIDGCLVRLEIATDMTERKQIEEALRTREQQYRLLIQHLHAGVIVHAMNTQIMLANHQAAQLLGLSIEQMLGKTAIDPAWAFVREDETLMPVDEYPVNRVLATRQPVRNLVIGIYRPCNDDWIWVFVNAFPELDVQGDLRQVVVTFIDITERKQAEAALQRKQAMLERTESIAQVGSWEWDIATDTMTWSDELFRIFQRNPADGAPSFAEYPELYEPAEMQRLQVAVSAAINEGTPYELELRIIRQDGTVRVCLTRGQAEKGPKRQAMRLFGSLQDITERKHLESALREMAITDDLTGLANRRHFITCLNEELARLQRHDTQRAVVLMLDLDHFKSINDTFGHATGDAVLRHCAALMSDSLRKIDKVGRIGGEEFAILLSGADLAAAQGFAERLRQKVAEMSIVQEGQSVSVTVSVGVAALEARDASVDAALGRADAALYQAKAGGRNQVVIATGS